jgi:outer membrane protein TolC
MKRSLFSLPISFLLALNLVSNAVAADAPPPSQIAQDARKEPLQISSIGTSIDTSIDHQQSNRMRVGPVHLNSLPNMPALAPLRLEASITQNISLPMALRYALENSLPIKVANESACYQKWQLAADVALALPLPGVGLSYGDVFSNVLTADTHALASNFQPTIQTNLFVGGSQVNGMMAQYYRYKGWQHAYYTSINDALLDVYTKYENLLLQRTLVQIRAKSLETAERAVAQSESLYTRGIGSNLATAQSRIRLDYDQQALLDQQLNLRLASLALAYAINAPLGVNLVPRENNIAEHELWDENLPVNKYLDLAMAHNPELRQAEYYRLSSRRNVALAASALYPTLSVDGQYTFTNTQSSLTPAGVAIQNQTGNTPDPSGAGVFPGIFDTLQTSYNLGWAFTNLDIPSIANLFETRALSKQAELQANRELLDLTEEVRVSYLRSLIARTQIDDLAYSVASAGETLRLSEDRLSRGTNSNSELVFAQAAYSDLSARQALSIFTSNVNQAKLLHDTGVISFHTLLNGFKLTDAVPKHATGKADN